MFISLIKRFWKEESGLTVLEYVLGAAALAGLLSVFFDDYIANLKAALDAIVP